MSTTSTTQTSTLPPHPSTPSPKLSWQRGPIPLIQTPLSLTLSSDPDASQNQDQYPSTATEMALVHNCIIRALNSIYLQAPHIPTTSSSADIGTREAFVRYCVAAYDGLSAHHHGEESFLFPEIEKVCGEGVMGENVEQHAAFSEGFERWGEWLRNIQSQKPGFHFNGEECVKLMDRFIGPLATHLHSEIPTLLSLSESEFKDKLDLKGLMAKEGENVMGSLSKTTQLPLFWANHDTTYEGGIHTFPPIPAPVRWVLREVFGRWNAMWWEFGCVGFDGRPRELGYLGKGERE